MTTVVAYELEVKVRKVISFPRLFQNIQTLGRAARISISEAMFLVGSIGKQSIRACKLSPRPVDRSAWWR